MRRKAFTLVELLIVVGIIAVLLALLLPALNYARFQAHVTQCAANERQFVAAMTSYAGDFNDYFPRFDAGPELTGADNPHDLTYEFCTYLKGHYNQPHSSFYCPFTDDVITSGNWAPGGFVEIGYAYWVPRVGNPYPSLPLSPVNYPPDPGTGAIVNGTQIIHGPTKLGDPLAYTNPVLTDDVYLFPSVPVNSPGFSIANAPAEDFYQQNSTHLYRGQLNNFNEAYADGHVETLTPDRIQWRYESGNAWCVR